MVARASQANSSKVNTVRGLPRRVHTCVRCCTRARLLYHTCARTRLLYHIEKWSHADCCRCSPGVFDGTQRDTLRTTAKGMPSPRQHKLLHIARRHSTMSTMHAPMPATRWSTACSNSSASRVAQRANKITVCALITDCGWGFNQLSPSTTLTHPWVCCAVPSPGGLDHTEAHY
jgi:hypothetical protein